MLSPAELDTLVSPYTGVVSAVSEFLRATGEPRQPSLEVLFDYFAGEIFKNSDPETQEVLLHTAVLPRVTASILRQLFRRSLRISASSAAQGV